MSKLVKLPTKQRIDRLINWSLVSQVERSDKGGVYIFFVDGRRVWDGRTIDQVAELIAKFWKQR
jgi:hypothetical protein